MNRAEIKIEDFMHIVEDINLLSQESNDKLSLTKSLLGRMNDTALTKDTDNYENQENIRELTAERDEFKTLADSLIEKLNNIEQDFFKEKEILKSYYEKAESEELEYLRDEMKHKESLVEELNKELVFQKKNFESTMETLERKVLTLKNSYSSQGNQLAQANKDVVELKLKLLTSQADFSLQNQNTSLVTDQQRYPSVLNTNANWRASKASLESGLFDTMGESNSYLPANGNRFENKALTTGLSGISNNRKASNITLDNSPINDSNDDVSSHYNLDTLEGHSENFLRYTKAMFKRKGTFTMDKKISDKIEYALENIREAGINMVKTLGFSDRNIGGSFATTGGGGYASSIDSAEAKSTKEGRQSYVRRHYSIKNNFNTGDEPRNSSNSKNNYQTNYDSNKSCASNKAKKFTGSQAKKITNSGSHTNPKSSEKLRKNSHHETSQNFSSKFDKKIISSSLIPEKLNSKLKGVKTPINGLVQTNSKSYPKKSPTVSSRYNPQAADAFDHQNISPSITKSRKIHQNTLSITARDISNDREIIPKRERETAKDYYKDPNNNHGTGTKDYSKDNYKKSISFNLRNILRKKSTDNSSVSKKLQKTSGDKNSYSNFN
jgi:hypothetical protein